VGRAIELMPGLMPRVIRDLKQATDKPILAAGLIKSVAEVQTALDAGATAAVVGKQELWDLELV
jgi:glycerol uptake operon antiterminator